MSLQLLTSYLTRYVQQQGKTQYDFIPRESAADYEKNLKLQSSDWVWRSRPLRYTVNTQAYRCGEFDSLDWSNSIVCFGCSNTFGDGVDDFDVWPHLLSELVLYPTINLGYGGMGWDFNWVNSLRVIQAGHKPRAVVYYWPNTVRMFTLPEESDLNFVWGHGAWTKDKDPKKPQVYLGSLWSEDPLLGPFWAEQYKLCLDIMWNQCGVPVVHTTWFEGLKVPGVEHIALFSHSLRDLSLRARDLLHPGIEDHRFIAQEIYSRLIAIDPSL
jgi:hypothetical protein